MIRFAKIKNLTHSFGESRGETYTPNSADGSVNCYTFFGEYTATLSLESNLEVTENYPLAQQIL